MLVLKGHTDSVRCLAYAPDGGALATGSDDGTLRFWNPTSGTVLGQPEKLSSWVEALAFAPHSADLTVGLADGGLHRFARQGNQWVQQRAGWLQKTLSKLTATKPAAVRALAYSPDGQRLAVARWDRRLQVLNAPNLGVLSDTLSPVQITGLAFSRDGRVLAGAAANGIIQLFHGVTGQGEGECRGATAGALCVTYSPDGQLLASGHADGSVLLWTVAKGQSPVVLSGHRWTVFSAAFSPAGDTLLTGSADGTVRLWNVATRGEQAALQWHTQAVTAVAFAPDGMTAAAASSDNTVVVWDVG
ncbi:MAG: WD40 repeat domain-containing protein [Planctomycetia bacterium]|nr:WD40 repeat domain-containing protein [Planctomycetia bacterium]